MAKGQYIVSAKVCDVVKIKHKRKKVCDTIESIPVDHATAKKIKRQAKRKVPKAHIKIRKHRG